jgi:hypothetical protein
MQQKVQRLDIRAFRYWVYSRYAEKEDIPKTWTNVTVTSDFLVLFIATAGIRCNVPLLESQIGI